MMQEEILSVFRESFHKPCFLQRKDLKCNNHKFSPRVLLNCAFSYYWQAQLFFHVSTILIFNLLRFQGMSIHEKKEEKRTCHDDEDARGSLSHRHFSSALCTCLFLFISVAHFRLRLRLVRKLASSA